MPLLHRKCKQGRAGRKRGPVSRAQRSAGTRVEFIPKNSARGALQTPISGLPEIGAKCAQVG
jgi:hypothetical protein